MSEEGDLLAQALAGEDQEKVALRKKVQSLEQRLLSAGDVKSQLDEATVEIGRLEKELGTFEALGMDVAPKWLNAVPSSKSSHHATPVLMLSDLHLDEVVRPEELNGTNAYNREIALMRLERLGANFVRLCRDHWSGVIYDGCVMIMGGDIFSGEIHDELKETNDDTMIGSLIFWQEPLARLISLLADEFGKVHVPVVVGNHGRTTRKPRSKFRARSNFDYALGHALARTFANDDRVTFDIPDAPDCRFEIYGRGVLLTHGDQATGGSGIGGIWPPIMRLLARKRAYGDAVGQPFDLMVIGHWHQLVYGKGFIVNGAMKGHDEYAMTQGFPYEVPSQAAWLMTPEHGMTWTAPVFCQQRDKEGW